MVVAHVVRSGAGVRIIWHVDPKTLCPDAINQIHDIVTRMLKR